ncbi:uncharacterized protein LOC144440126 [Glandiceps talaboti]
MTDAGRTVPATGQIIISDVYAKPNKTNKKSDGNEAIMPIYAQPKKEKKNKTPDNPTTDTPEYAESTKSKKKKKVKQGKEDDSENTQQDTQSTDPQAPHRYGGLEPITYKPQNVGVKGQELTYASLDHSGQTGEKKNPATYKRPGEGAVATEYSSIDHLKTAQQRY